MAYQSRADRIASVAALDDPTSRAVFDYVAGRPDAVTRDAAAEALGVSRRIAAAHLDKLAAQGLLTIEFRRLHDRRGPGAGRPAKLYARTPDELLVSVPDRRYELAATLLAAAVTEAMTTGAEIGDVAPRIAYETGHQLARRELIDHRPSDRDAAGHGSAGREAAEPEGPEASGPVGDDASAVTLELLTRAGYEPRRTEVGLVLSNCPFHRLARSYTELVCGLNLHLLHGLTDAAEAPYRAVLDPAPERCCVRLENAERGGDGRQVSSRGFSVEGSSRR
ncbi:transcriptional regulator [Actinoplanes sp. Pm04-4]|uniref:Transcriptional regulator n=1 Tax=Paractinoplanes pyxinae TaxID=2997416 RepID=A0ABT4AXG6_9ACTN|nr:helix-turn-helix domain-containing protein [Actinoplanes pyxinae]MCY1138933.1 transcriptional regulator [Actinoplanes pyxinae]